MYKSIFIIVLLISIIGNPGEVWSQKQKQGSGDNSKKDLKFLDDIVVDVPATNVSSPSNNLKNYQSSSPVINYLSNNDLEKANSLQFKYALLLDMEVEQIQNLSLFRLIDDWWGTHYRLGGNSKSGIDCSAFMQVLFSSIYKISLPRTAHEQYATCRKISRTELKEGDLVFFNTTGRVSHVGMYLQNNKFVHASHSGVIISDLYEDYWVRKFIGAGRIDTFQTALNSQP